MPTPSDVSPDEGTADLPSRGSSPLRIAVVFLLVALIVLVVTWLIGRDLLEKSKGALYNLRAFQHLFVRYDLPGAIWAAAVLAGALAFARPLPEQAVNGLTGWISDHRRVVALLVTTVLALIAPVVYQDYPLAIDEFAPYLQAQVFAAGKLYAQYPPELIKRLLPIPDQFFRYSTITGQAIEGNYPSWAVLLTPFMLLGAPWVANPIAGGGVVLLMGSVADQLFPGRKNAAGWAILLTVASPVVTLNAISYYTMNLHLLVALAYAALLLNATPVRLVAAGLVGTIGLTLNNPLPHAMYAAPWILWLAWQPGRVRHLCFLGLGYLPVLGIVAWWIHSQGQVPLAWAPPPPDAGASHSFMEVVKGQLTNGAFGVPHQWADVPAFLAIRGIWYSKLYLWSVPGLACIAFFGFWKNRARVPFRLLAGSFACIAVAYLFVKVDQGHGWGSRYLHPVWGVLPLFGTAWLLLDPVGRRWQRYFLTLAVASLCVLTPVRMLQVREFITEARAQTPAHDPSRPQMIFLRTTPSPERYYAWDAIRNDPFLRGNTIIMGRTSSKEDADLVQKLFPGATMASEEVHGTVWNLP